MKKGQCHLSFDLWSTLLKSNPEFKLSRAGLFHKKYNPKGFSKDEISSIFSRVGLWGNAINAKTGRSLSSEELYLLVLATLNGTAEGFGEINMEELYVETESLFFANHPVFYDSDTADVLWYYYERGFTMNVLSNTAFVKGKTLRHLLAMLGVDKCFSFQLYSDELGCSKPSRKIFDILVKSISDFSGRTYEPRQIIHIGDDLFADIRGAEDCGLRAFQINSNSNCIQDLLSLC